MGRTENLTQLECDRCGAKEVVTAKSPSLGYWHDVARISADGVETGRLLCDECYDDYVHLASSQDAEFVAFMENKG